MTRIRVIYLLMSVLFASAAVHSKPAADHKHHDRHDEHDVIFDRLNNVEWTTGNMTLTVNEHTEDLKDIKDTLELMLLLADAEEKKKLFLEAVKVGNALLVQLLLKSRVDIDVETKIGESQHSLWDLAVLADRKEIAKALLAGKTLDDNERSLLNAAKTGSTSQLNSLKKKGVNLEVRDPENEYATPLILAAANNHLNVVKELLKAKINVESRDLRGQTALFVAAKKGHKEILNELLKNNADPAARTGLGLTPILLAFDSDIAKLISDKMKEKTTSSQV